MCSARKSAVRGCRQTVCYCPAGSPSVSDAGRLRHQRQASDLWRLWQQQQKLFRPQATVDIQLPKLVQRYKHKPGEDDLTDGTAEADAEKALRHATKAAEAAVSRAMHAAAVAGLDYTPPKDMETDMPRADKVDSRQVERRARAAQQSMLQRAHRREKAQADAAHAQMLAAQQMDRPSSQRHRHSAGGPATLQQMLHQNKDQVHQALENSPSWDTKQRSRQHALQAGPASSSARQAPKQAPANLSKKGSTQNPKSRLSKQTEPEHSPAHPRNSSKSRPQSPTKPLSPSINPAIQAKLQQVHNRLLGPGKAGKQSDEAAERPASAKAGGRSAHKAAVAAQPDEAWEDAPPRQMLLRMKDIQPAMQDKWLQLYWPDDGKWWPAQVIDVDPKAHKAQLLYETGEAENLDLGPMVRKGEVAWLHKRDMPGAGHADPDDGSRSAQQQYPSSPPANPKKRKEAPAGKQKQAEAAHKRATGKLYRGDSEDSLDHPGMAAPRRQRAAASRPGSAAAPADTHGSRQSGGANRQQHADQNVMQVGMEAILKLASDAVGRNVHVFLSEHGSWYNARVRQCLPGQGTVHVQYESGEKDVLKAKEQGKRYNIRLMPISVRTAA